MSRKSVPLKNRWFFAAAWLLDPLLISAATSPPSRAGAADFLKQLRARIILSQPFRVDFVQQVFVDEEMVVQESGVIVFADRSRVKWQYLDPTPKTFIMENGAYRFHDPENNQLLRGRVGERGEQLIWELLFSDRPGNDSSWDAGSRTIRLRLDGEKGVQELEITIGSDLLPARVRQTAAGEVTTVYVFKNYRSRIALGGGEFELDLPSDVEIIDEQAP
jgi:outer membrane lipoprotein-sorting protein